MSGVSVREAAVDPDDAVVVVRLGPSSRGSEASSSVALLPGGRFLASAHLATDASGRAVGVITGPTLSEAPADSMTLGSHPSRDFPGDGSFSPGADGTGVRTWGALTPPGVEPQENRMPARASTTQARYLGLGRMGSSDSDDSGHSVARGRLFDSLGL